MKFLLLTAFIAAICTVSAGGKTQRLLAAMNAGMLAGMNGGGMLAGLNGGLINGVNPAMLAGGLTLPVVAGGGAGFIGQPQFAQFVPRVPVYAVPAPVPNVYPAAGANVQPPFMGVPQMAPGNPPQQPLMGNGGAMPQQLPLQADPMRRFRRQIMKSANILKAAVDTQIPPPAESTAATTVPCAKDDLHEDH